MLIVPGGRGALRLRRGDSPGNYAPQLSGDWWKTVLPIAASLVPGVGTVLGPAVGGAIQMHDAKKALGDKYKTLEWRQVQGPTGAPLMLGYDRSTGEVFNTAGQPVNVPSKEEAKQQAQTAAAYYGFVPAGTPGIVPGQVPSTTLPPYQSQTYQTGYTDQIRVTPQQSSGGFPSWAWALLGLGALLVLK